MTPIRLIAIHQDGSPAEPVAPLGPEVRDALTGTAGMYRSSGYQPPWIGYLAMEGDAAVGTCAFKSPPQNHRVEIAYFTFPPHEGRGVATAMAEALIALARHTDPSLTLTAQTLPEDGASTRILRRLGFGLADEVVHPEDGTVWEWRLAPLPIPATPLRLLLLGNAGAGKSTLARRLIAGRPIPRLSLDAIAWTAGTQRSPLQRSRRELLDFIRRHDEWVIEGCYGDLIETALPHCTELWFLNPGVDVCVEHCRNRPWESEKFNTPTEQAAMLPQLIDWVKQYETRDDEYGLPRHRRIFEEFRGPKREFTGKES